MLPDTCDTWYLFKQWILKADNFSEKPLSLQFLAGKSSQKFFITTRKFVFNYRDCCEILYSVADNYRSHGEKSISCKPMCANFIICSNFSPPHNATPFWWNVARYVPWGDHRTYVSVHRYKRTNHTRSFSSQSTNLISGNWNCNKSYRAIL